MAKGDSQNVQNAVTTQTGQSQNNLTNQNNYNTGQTGNFQSLYAPAAAQANNDYGGIQGGITNMLSGMPNTAGAYDSFYGGNMNGGAINPAISGYSSMAGNGGFSDSDIASMKAAANAPNVGIASNANAQIQRQAALRGTGYSPNTAAAISQNNRNAAYQANNTTTNTEAQIAQLQQQGKLYGLGGLASTGLGEQGQNLSAIGQGANTEQGLLGQLTSLYGTTPGLANMYGNQLLGSSGQGINLAGLQNQLAGININGQVAQSQVPGNFSSALGNIAGTAGLIGNGFLAGQSGGLW